MAAPRGYIALYPRAWRVASASDLVARRGAVNCRWVISAERGRRITLFSARIGARLYRADKVSAEGQNVADGLWCPASIQLLEFDVPAAAFNVCLRRADDDDLPQRASHDAVAAKRQVYESKASQLEVRLNFDKDQVSMTRTDQWRLSDSLHILYYMGMFRYAGTIVSLCNLRLINLI